MLERTLEASQSHDETEEESLENEEDTSTATGEADENESESEEDTSTNESDDVEAEAEEVADEESVEALKARLEKAERDRDNYKSGMLSAKGKKRGDVGLDKTNQVKDVNEAVVVGVLEKRTEKQALYNTISPKHSDFIPELVDDNQYQEIIGYLPRNLEKTSYDSIVRGLKLATRMWKEEKGIKDKPIKKSNDLHTSKSTFSSVNSERKSKPGERKILRRQAGAQSWY